MSLFSQICLNILNVKTTTNNTPIPPKKKQTKKHNKNPQNPNWLINIKQS